jgi:hypothetical protein
VHFEGESGCCSRMWGVYSLDVAAEEDAKGEQRSRLCMGNGR